MHLTDNDLKQLRQEYLDSLSLKQLRHLSGKMLDDLRDARDRLNQTPENSSRPSGSFAPWEQAASLEAKKEEEKKSTLKKKMMRMKRKKQSQKRRKK